MATLAAFLDHLVVAADTLDQGSAYLKLRLGIYPAGGGQHAAMGTHNRVLKLGRGRYLEVIAIDPEGRHPEFPRWFNLDDPTLQARLKIRPRLIAWVARTDTIDIPVEEIYGQRMDVRHMHRDAMRWRFAFTEDGSMPGNGIIPHLIQWDGHIHPAEKMRGTDLMLMGIEGAHINPAFVQRVITSMGLDNAITVHPVSKQRQPGLFARIKTPVGVVVLD